VLAAAERTRHTYGHQIDGDHIRQHCPYCWTWVTTPAPTVINATDTVSRHINNSLDDAVLEHTRRDCTATDRNHR